ncbi:MAG: glutamate formimidoyltransferase [Bacteroidetes bacterium]|jgi:glutamate formiminotransferase/formiminotetrahydrofolate cyclodeaminase|nr:glutamate formimidoyltransferase [Bacteroidota bacterium]
MKKLIECVPNFSEGRDASVIQQITNAIEAVDGVTLLDVDPGKATNRTVVTFVGEPDAVVEGAYQGIVAASKLIDMSKHSGEHARMGATDVCPFIPVANISLEETAEYAIKLAQRVGADTSIPVYLYGASQKQAYRNDLSVIRSGEYEGFFNKIKEDKWKPDFGKAEMNVFSGATVIGARDFLIAYNVNLNTTSTRIANRIAFDVREAGRVKRTGNPYSGPIAKDEKGETIRIPGSCKEVKAVGWFIEEYGVAQISANLTNYHVTPVHTFFDEVEKSAISRGVRVTGSELVGLVPLKAMLEAGRHYLVKQGRSIGVSEREIVHIAVKTLGLDELGPFDPDKKIIEYALKRAEDTRLVDMTCTNFANETASESMAPGGGSISAYVGSLGAALSSMVANLGANKRGWEDRVTEFSDWAVKAQTIKDKLLFYVDEDTRSFNGIIDAIRLPKDSDAEKLARKNAIEDASIYATEVPKQVMETAFQAYACIDAMITKGNKSSVTDAGVGALCIDLAIQGAGMNVLVNAKDLANKETGDNFKKDALNLMVQSNNESARLRKLVLEVLEA